MFSALYFCIFVRYLAAVHGESWNYYYRPDSPMDSFSENGQCMKYEPSPWCKTEPRCCGRQQSPIDLPYARIREMEVLYDYVKFQNYDVKPRKMTIENTGFTIMLRIETDQVQPSLYVAEYKSTYMFHSVQYHWGNRSNFMGSEHTLDGYTYDVEMQIFHYHSNYSSYEMAVKSKHPHALAILSQLYMYSGRIESAEITGPFAQEKKKFQFFDYLEEITYKGQKTEIPTKSLSDLLDPFNCNNMRKVGAGSYIYSGSLTTPPCTENVLWVVRGKTDIIPGEMLGKLYDLYATEQNETPKIKLINNFRSPEPRNGRKIIVILNGKYEYTPPTFSDGQLI